MCLINVIYRTTKNEFVKTKCISVKGLLKRSLFDCNLSFASKKLTRKNLMVKNLKRYRKSVDRESGKLEAAKYDFFPTTFELPVSFTDFLSFCFQHVEYKARLGP